MHGDRIFFSNQNLNSEDPNSIPGTNTNFQRNFKIFLSDFNKENVRIYHKQISAMVQHNKYYLLLQLSDLKVGDELLYEQLLSKPLQMLSVMEEALKSYVKQRKQQFSNYNEDSPWQICIQSDQNPKRLRQIESKFVNTIFTINGIIISCTKPYIKARQLKIKCKSCQTVKTIKLSPGQYPSIPMLCLGNGSNKKCPPDPFVALPQSLVIDSQSMKIQQNPEDIPTGEIARTYQMLCDRYNVNKCVPGDRVKITGIMMVNELKSDNLSKGIFYVVGIEKLKERTHIKYTSQEEEEFKRLSKDPQLYQKIYRSIAPGIYGNQDVKKIIACMLFGGSRKHLPDKTVLRGDINVLLMGDPSTAKSQFLKFVQQTSTIAVYTSGKGSSAAGLTASINKDPSTGQFQIQGGALVLADGGIVCIDQFDKMKAADRVAIHEAMEQQTISIAKAGITTRLNSRASVLAAANPVFGRYNQTMQITDQIDLKNTILSRFDSIFIMRDINTKQNNQRTAQHILNVQQGKNVGVNSQIPFEVLKKYINFARSKILPRLTPIACQKLQNIYIQYRQKAKDNKVLTKNSIPITVRQLQAVVRLSQALAKMKLKSEVSIDEVAEANYLFNVSTMKTITEKQFAQNCGNGDIGQIEKAQQIVRKRLCIGNEAPISNLITSLPLKISQSSIETAIIVMIKNGQLKSIKNGKSVIRQK